MATVNLTDKAVSAAKAKPNERLELWDAKTPGLCLRVSTKGKVWIYRYRTLDGRQPRLKLGLQSDAFGLADARAKAEKLRVQVHEGGDPAGEKRVAKDAARNQPIRTFDDLADAYLQACRDGHWTPKGKKKSAQTLADEEGSLKRHIRPALGKLKLSEVTRAEVRKFLRSMKAKGIGAQTNKALQVIRQAFAWAIAEFEGRLVDINPGTGQAPAPIRARVRVLTDAELKAFWGGLVDPSKLRIQEEGAEGEGEEVSLSRLMAIALQLSTLLLQRRNEVIGIMTSDLNLDDGLWLIPAEKTKSKTRPQLVPLPLKSVELLKEAANLARPAWEKRAKALKVSLPNDLPLFPSPRNAFKSMRADSVTHAMAAVTKALEIKGAAPHDLRRTGSTALTSERLGISPFIRSQVLGHADAGGGAVVSATHYDANSYISEKRRALEAWEALLMAIVGERERSPNVTSIRVA